MAYEIEGRERLASWLAATSNFDALFAVWLWLERIRTHGPNSQDDVIGPYLRVHAEGTVLITYTVPPQQSVIVIENILDLGPEQ